MRHLTPKGQADISDRQIFNLLLILDLTKRTESSSFVFYENLMLIIGFGVILLGTRVGNIIFAFFCEIKKYFQTFAHFNRILDSYKIDLPHQCTYLPIAMDSHAERC